MDDLEFEDAAELVGILGCMMKRKSFETTPRIGMGSPGLVAQGGVQTSSGARGPGSGGATAEGPSSSGPATQTQPRSAMRSRETSKSSPRQKESERHEITPHSMKRRSAEGGSQDTTPRARHVSVESGASRTPRAPQEVGGRSPATPSTVRSMHHATGTGGSQKGTPVIGSSTPLTPSAAATLASDTVRRSPILRRSPPMRSSPTQEKPHPRQQR